MKIIARYITKELLFAFLPILGVLLLIVLSNRFAIYLARVAAGELSLSLVVQVVLLSIPELLAYLIPLSWFVGLLFSYGRLHADSEMTVLAASGVTQGFIVRKTLKQALILMVLMLGLTGGIVPKASLEQQQLLSKGRLSGMFVAQRFQSLFGGKVVFYADSLDKEGKLHEVFIVEDPQSEAAVVTRAKQAEIVEYSDETYITLTQGYRYEGVPGLLDYRTIAFQEYGRSLESKPEGSVTKLRSKETMGLFQTTDRGEIAELQWRLSLPISVLVLTLIALPLSQVDPRRSRFAKFLPGIILYILYFNLFTISKRWIVSGVLSPLVGVWWVHLLFVGIALALFYRRRR